MSEIRQTIGHIICPICGDRAEVRRNKKGKLYYLGKAGMITPNKPAGQDWILENMEAMGKQEKEAFNTAPTEYGQRSVTATQKLEPSGEVEVVSVHVGDQEVEQVEQEQEQGKEQSWLM